MQIHRLAVPLFAAALTVLAAGAAVAQTHPVTDGIVGRGEYAVAKQEGGLQLHASFDAETIYLAVEGRTSGWVAIGVGSARMNGAKIFMGYVAGGTESFTTQGGLRHSHSESSAFSALSHAVRESNGVTTMEIALDRHAFLDAGQTTLEVIYAMGSDDSFRQYHSQRASTSLSVE